MKTAFFVVGEDSGDVLAANLIRALKEKHGDSIECCGIGGPLMKEAGFTELLPMDQISVIGIWEVLPKLPQIYRIFTRFWPRLKSASPIF